MSMLDAVSRFLACRSATARRLVSSGRPHIAVSLMVAGGVGGCGVQVPSIEPLARSQQEVAHVVNNIANHVGCEIRNAVLELHKRYHSPILWQRIAWIDSWAAKVTLKILVEEKTTFAPGVTFKTIFPNATTTFGTQIITTGQTFSFGIGGQFSTDATRTEQVGFFLPFKDLIARPGECRTGVGPYIQGDLKFSEWLNAALFLEETPGTLSESVEAPYDVISHEIQFVVIAGGNVTPTWTLLSVTANPIAPLLGATRTRTDDVLITMGPTVNDAAGKLRPSPAVDYSHLASQIVSGIRNQLP
jgi:hypothetical protein